MATVVNIHQAKTYLSKFVDEAAAGREVIIAKAGRKMARLLPIEAKPRPKKLGGLKGRIKVPDDFNVRLDSSVIAAQAKTEPLLLLANDSILAGYGDCVELTAPKPRRT